jgi:hypothetical protein
MSHRTPFLSAYLKAISSSVDDDMCHCDFSPQLELQAKTDCEHFEFRNQFALSEAYAAGLSEADAGRDFWLVRNSIAEGFNDNIRLVNYSTGQGPVTLYAHGEQIYCY